MADIFTTLFQASLNQGIVPPDWKTANIVPLFKTNRRVDILDLSSDLRSTREHVPTLEENEY